VTRERAKELAPVIKAWGDGFPVQFYTGGEWEDFNCTSPDWFDNSEYRIKPEPRTRPMTRGEVLYEITAPVDMVTRYVNEGAPRNIYPIGMTPFYDDDFNLMDYEYAIIDKHGYPVDGWHKFEVTE